MKPVTFQLLIVVLTFSGAAALGQEEEARWPQFRGVGGQGIGGEGLRLPTKFGPAKNLVWKMEVPRGHSSPCVWDERIFVTGCDEAAKKIETICVERRTGKILWRQTAPATKFETVDKVNSLASSTAACDGERVYVYFGSFGLLCYDMEGKLVWQRELQPIFGRFGSGTSPVVAGDFVLLNSGKGLASLTLLALDRKSGKTVWEKERPRGMMTTGLWSTPVVRHSDKGDEVVVAGGDQVAAYGLADGAPRWQIKGLPSVSQSTPAFGDGLMFLTLTNPIGDLEDNVVKFPPFDELLKKYDKNHDGKLSADEIPEDMTLFTRGRDDKLGDWAKARDLVKQFDKNKDNALDREEWQAMLDYMGKAFSDMKIAVAAIRLDGQGDVSQTNVVWKESKSVPDVPSPLYYQGRVYLVNERGIVTCRDAKTGKEIYRERLGGRGICYASPVVGDNKIYVGCDGGVLVVFKPGDRFEVLAKNDLGEAILATPALVDNSIYVRTDKHLFAFKE